MGRVIINFTDDDKPQVRYNSRKYNNNDNNNIGDIGSRIQSTPPALFRENNNNNNIVFRYKLPYLKKTSIWCAGVQYIIKVEVQGMYIILTCADVR